MSHPPPYAVQYPRLHLFSPAALEKEKTQRRRDAEERERRGEEKEKERGGMVEGRN